MKRLADQLHESSRALREVYRNRRLRRLQLAWAGSIIGTWAYSVAIVVYAYHQGGASAVGLVGLIRWLPRRSPRRSCPSSATATRACR